MSIATIAIEGFKSIRNRLDLELRGLTVLAGVNSSGKSSAMQPLLLLKQTYEKGYDPGPLDISGPNVAFSQVDQMFWKAPGQDLVDRFTVGMTWAESGNGVEVIFVKGSEGRLPIVIERCVWRMRNKFIVLTPEMDSAGLESAMAGVLEEEESQAEGDTFERPFDSLREGLRKTIIKMRDEGLVRPELFIDKPIDPDELIERVKELIGE